MSKIKIICPECAQPLLYDDRQRARQIKCPHCKQLIPLAPAPPSSVPRPATANPRRTRRKPLLIAVILVLLIAATIVTMWIMLPARLHWPDRRPIGILFLASNFHASATNPRGWFNDPNLDITGPDGPQHFRQALFAYTDRSLAILKRTRAQGVIVWDLEGEQFPHKITFIGDPRLLDRLAPEMMPVVDEFFTRLRNAGLKVGLTVRPQQLILDSGLPRQTQVVNLKQSLLQKIDYARNRWGATLFYVDSNGGIRRPDEVWQLSRLAAQRPDILLIPEHHYLPYWSFSAPYVPLSQGNSAGTANWARRLFPGSFQALDISNTDRDGINVAAAWRKGDILMFRAWFWNRDCELVEDFTSDQPPAPAPPR